MKVLITGGGGLVGSSFEDIDTDNQLILVGSSDADLKSRKETEALIAKNQPDAIIHLAAKVGGVKGNSDFVADFFHENILINTNVLNFARQFRVPKVVSLLSTCIYPDSPVYPLTEEQIHNGEPHPSNFGYAYAKRMLEIHSRAIRIQYGLNYITAVPNNIYGMRDNFDLENGHVIPSLIRKFHEAKIKKTDVTLWGSGTPLREFTYSKDIAKALIFLLENYEGDVPINIGSTKETSIKDVSKIISKEMNYTGRIIWNTDKPEGQFKKPSSNKKFLNMCPDFVYTELEEGLKETISWFTDSYPNIRGLQ